MKDLTVMGTAASAAPQPILMAPERLLAGSPAPKLELVAKSRDKTNWVVVWECSVGSFNTHFDVEETCVIISGEVFVTPEGGAERRLGPGDFAFFPACSCSKWRVTETVRKVAIRRIDLPPLLAFAARVWFKLLRITGLRSAPNWAAKNTVKLPSPS